MEARAAAQPMHLFVYGSLRPDDCYSNAEWTKPFNANMTGSPAFIKQAKLYYDKWPVVFLEGSELDTVQGFVLTTKDPKDWETKLREADAIEDYPTCYQRHVVNAILKDGTIIPSWVYTSLSAKKTLHIPSGDWISWIKEKKNNELHRSKGNL